MAGIDGCVDAVGEHGFELVGESGLTVESRRVAHEYLAALTFGDGLDAFDVEILARNGVAFYAVAVETVETQTRAEPNEAARILENPVYNVVTQAR